MDIFSILTLFGGLALFLYGMNVMGTGLERVSGGKLESILERLTSTPIKGVLLGAGVTAIIQSSSATTVMVVGFVNSGIMKLNQVIGIIMGANLGTTATAWILSLTGLEGDSFLVQIFKPTSFTPILAVIGVVLFMFSKSSRKKEIGTILLGFAVLMFGMDAMSGAVKPLADVPEFTNILVMFSNPVLGVLTGAVLTAIIQSSSASVGILQALSSTGKITFGAAVPIIMGQNIGTCVTALISSIGASKNARRAAMIHLYFNIIGTVLFMAIFYTCKAVLDFSFLDGTVNAAGIAMVHTVFNLVATSCLLPFTKGLEKLAYLTIREGGKKQDEFQLLDERFLATPSFAIEQCKNLTIEMANLSRDNLFLAIELTKNYRNGGLTEVNQNEEKIDMYEDKLGTYLVKLSAKSLSMQDSKQISKLLHTIGDFERISDHAVNIAKTAKEINSKKISFSDQARSELDVLSAAIHEILAITIQSFDEDDLSLAAHVEPLEQVIDILKNALKTRHVQRLQEGECTIELGFIFSDLLTNYERVADHCSNIAVCLIQVSAESFDTHEYLNEIKSSKESEFTDLFAGYKEKYVLPV